jgi:hypothetical protein
MHLNLVLTFSLRYEEEKFAITDIIFRYLNNADTKKTDLQPPHSGGIAMNIVGGINSSNKTRSRVNTVIILKSQI